jgi:peptidoglycan/xylan/chitin deacetylase (PgdA/CDA1 family)
MLNSVRARIVFVVVMSVLIFCSWKFNISRYEGMLIVLAVLSYLLLIAYGSYFIQSNFFIKALSHGSKEHKAIAITFDDGPMKDFTPRLLDLLKAENVPAAFFLIGKNIAGNEALVKRMVDEGHVIGNHSYSHTYWFSLNSGNNMLRDLQLCDEEIIRVTGKKPKFFRPPYGVTNPMVKSAVEKGNYDCIGWSIRTYDTNAKSAAQLLQKSLKKLSNGDIVLFHDWGQFTIGILSAFIKEAQARGFEIVRVDDLLNTKAYY